MKTQHLSLRNIHRIASQLPPPPTSVLAQIAALPDLPFADIKAMWKQLFGADVPTHNRQFLHKRIAHRLQEDVLRVTHPELIERNQQRMRQLLAMAKNASSCPFLWSYTRHIAGAHLPRRGAPGQGARRWPV